MVDYYKRLVEVDEVLNYLSFEELNKIPAELRKAIKDNKDKNYFWEYDKTKQLSEQGLSKETIDILAYLNMEYLVNKEQKEFLEQVYKANTLKLEKLKSESDIGNNFFENKKATNNTTSSNCEKKDLIEKESLWLKIINRIKMFFKK